MTEVYDDFDDFPEPDPVEDECYIVEYTVRYSEPGASKFVPVVRGSSGLAFSEDEAGIITKHSIIGNLLDFRKEIENQTIA